MTAQRNGSGLRHEVLSQESIADAIGVLVNHYSLRKQTLTLAQVGACNGRIANDHLHEIIKGRLHVVAHLIEAVDWIFDQLVRVMEPYAERIHCYHTALGARDEIRPFYSVSPRYSAEQTDAKEWIQYQIGSLTNVHLKLHVPEKYIVANTMRVESPSTFMSRVGIDPETLNLLMVDAEGFDAEIVCSFLDVSLPDLVVYEHHVMSREDNERTYKHLDERGYSYKVIGYDVLACRSMD